MNIKRKMLKKMFTILSVIMLLAAILCIWKGIDKKERYYNSDYSSIAVNAYVGGDAYNYIINAGYFAGYFAIAGGCLTSATILFCAGILLPQEHGKEENQNYDIQRPQMIE